MENKKIFLSKIFGEERAEIVLNSKRFYKMESNQPMDIDLCQYMYEKLDLPIYKIAMLYGISDVTLRKHFIIKGVNLKGHRMGKNSFNNYFEQINSNDKAYFLGLLAADGHIMSKVGGKDEKRISIELTENDGYIIERFKNYANIQANLVVSHKEDIRPRLRLSICSGKMYDDLVSLGFVQNKSESGAVMPELRSDLIPHFIRGYFDGDGIAKSNGYVGFCGNIEILESIKNYLVNTCGLRDNTITYNKSNHIYYIQWASKKDRNTFFDVIYKDCSDLYLDRKYIKIKENL